ncbi:molecular chaperone TorD family protein [Aquabacterium sp.]|uniref:molecular chaperone TorD family protein n=1 Tax=Aquabacterium sp. TaxID=1872578 RepID=UPI0035AE25D6
MSAAQTQAHHAAPEGVLDKPAPDDDGAIDLLLWSRFFSPMLDDRERAEVFSALGLGSFETLAGDYWGTFHLGAPQSPVTVILHAELQLDGGDVREDLVRVMEHLQLDWAAAPLPPDHLAVVLELLAVSFEQEEPVLQHGLITRWLLPWATQVGQRLEGTAWQPVLARLADDLRQCPAPDAS